MKEWYFSGIFTVSINCFKWYYYIIEEERKDGSFVGCLFFD
ncbi:MAG: hypothetical protein DF198_0135 [Streptococcus phage VS-2018a]|uniref:Uncharacterized protein n=1 Tax=Streptococcus phage VS-2018a TaxID=2184051 RepID=A0A3G6K211_9CAUD|nr:MAG: hypothetical protein PQF12_gp27 [Streptococcus phage VS-2018a]AZA24397.1 MAG: hypothetical protein DF198_0135 [Streptococcus phage VS-2018a]